MNSPSSPPRPRILVLSSKLGYQARGFAAAADSLGIDLAFGTDRCHQLEDPWSDGALALHFEDPATAAGEITRHFSSAPPVAIFALGDRPTVTAALACEMLGIPGNPPRAAELCRDKVLQREALRAAGLHVPEFVSFPIEQPLEEILPHVPFPCVVKPAGLSASQGVIRADGPEEFFAAVRRIRALLESPEIQVLREPHLHRLLAEAYIPGAEVALEGLLDTGAPGPDFRPIALFDKPDPLTGPYFEETMYVTPSRHSADTQNAVLKAARQAIRALGLTWGPVHAEFRLNEHGVWPIEIAPRPIGGLCSRALRFGPASIPFEELLLRHAAGLLGRDLEREAVASGVMMIPVPRSGIFERVEFLDEAEAVPGVAEIRITARLRDFVVAWPEGSSYLGFIFARSATPAEAEAALREAHSKLQFVFSPRLPVHHPVSGSVR
jgi:biotin carboxylase